MFKDFNNFRHYIVKGMMLINSSLIFFHIDCLTLQIPLGCPKVCTFILYLCTLFSLDIFFSDCLDNNRIISVLILLCRGIGGSRLWVILVLPAFDMSQLAPGKPNVKDKKIMNWHELVQIPAFAYQLTLFRPVMWPYLVCFLICEMGPVLLCSLLWGLEIISIRVHKAWCTGSYLQCQGPASRWVQRIQSRDSIGN